MTIDNKAIGVERCLMRRPPTNKFQGDTITSAKIEVSDFQLVFIIQLYQKMVK